MSTQNFTNICNDVILDYDIISVNKRRVLYRQNACRATIGHQMLCEKKKIFKIFRCVRLMFRFWNETSCTGCRRRVPKACRPWSFIKTTLRTTVHHRHRQPSSSWGLKFWTIRHVAKVFSRATIFIFAKHTLIIKINFQRQFRLLFIR